MGNGLAWPCEMKCLLVLCATMTGSALQAFKMPKHSLERHLLVAAFAVAPYSAAKKTRKAMYGLHGETFEAVMPEKRVRFLAEQVCLPTAACSCSTYVHVCLQ